MRVMLASEAGSPDVRNDDWAGATSTGIAVVLDGLSESGPTGCRHGTGWYVHQLGTRLLAGAGDPAATLTDALAGAIDGVAAATGTTATSATRAPPRRPSPPCARAAATAWSTSCSPTPWLCSTSRPSPSR